MTDPTAELMAKARLGISMEAARESELYRFLMDCAGRARCNAIEALATTDPTDWRAVALLQTEVRFHDAIAKWVDAAILDGQGAYLALQQAEHED